MQTSLFFQDNIALNWIVIVNILLALILISYAIYLSFKERRLKKELKELEIHEAEIIESAQKKALEVITNSKYLSSSIKEDLKDVYLENIQEIKLENKRFYRELFKNYSSHAENIMTAVDKEGQKGITSLQAEVSSQVSKSQKEIDSQLKASYDLAIKEVDDYKKNLKDAVKEDYMKRVDEVVKKLLPDYISKQDQEKLVMEALNKAESEGYLK